MTAARYRHRPVEVDAIRWDGTIGCAEALMQWSSGTVAAQPSGSLSIQTLNGTVHAAVGEWVVRGLTGECYPCADGLFQALYEPAPRPAAVA